MDTSIIEKWPDFCFEGNRVSFQKMVRELRRYGYIREVDGVYDIHISLKNDYPELFEFIMGYVLQNTATKVAAALDQKKVNVVFDEDGNKRYEFQEDAFEMG